MFIVCLSFNVQRVFSLSSYVLSHFLSKARTENGNHGETLETSSTLSLSHFINISSLLSFLFSENAETIYIFIFSLFNQNFTRTELQTHTKRKLRKTEERRCSWETWEESEELKNTSFSFKLSFQVVFYFISYLFNLIHFHYSSSSSLGRIATGNVEAWNLNLRL